MRYFKLLLCFIAIVLSVACIGQTYSSIISDEEIVVFMNWKFENEKRYSEEPKEGPKKLYYRIYKLDTVAFYPTKRSRGMPQTSYLFMPSQATIRSFVDTLFSQADIDFMFRQYISQTDTMWRHNFKNTKYITARKAKRLKMMRNTYQVSIPLFSQDHKYVIIKQFYWCGTLCAYWCFKVYRKKEDNTWEYIDCASFQMS